MYPPPANIEWINPALRATWESYGWPKLAMFDFDGTLSLIRGGWLEIMTGLMLPTLSRSPGAIEPFEDLSRHLVNLLLDLNGQPTIRQMEAFVAEVTRRGGQVLTPDHYMDQFQSALAAAVLTRQGQLLSGEKTPADFLIPGSRPLLEQLVQHGATVAIVSGTIESAVRQEAEWLGVGPLSAGGIHGPENFVSPFSKHETMQRLLNDHALEPAQAIGFGDGVTEIRALRAMGIRAVGVASDEHHRSGKVDPVKREMLIAAGADVIIPDYTGWA